VAVRHQVLQVAANELNIVQPIMDTASYTFARHQIHRLCWNFSSG